MNSNSENSGDNCEPKQSMLDPKRCNLKPELMYKLFQQKILSQNDIQEIIINYRPFGNYDSESDTKSGDENNDEDTEDNELKVNDTEMDSQKSSKAETIVCDICLKSFTKSYITQHKEAVHEKIKRFFCSHKNCNQGFYQKQHMLNHIAKYHQAKSPGSKDRRMKGVAKH